MIRTLTAGSVLLLANTMLAEPSARPGIGTAVSHDTMRINEQSSPGSATLFEGSRVETTASPSTLLLAGNQRIDLAAASSGIAYGDHFVLQRGSVRATLRSGYTLESHGLLIRPQANSAAAVIRRNADDTAMTVESGTVTVSSGKGVLLARVQTNESVQMQNSGSGNSNKVRLFGVITSTGGRYFLQDKATGITQELVGQIPAAEVGKAVEVVGIIRSGQSPAENADRVVEVSSVRRSSGGCGSGDPTEAIQLTGPVSNSNGRLSLTDEKSGMVVALAGNLGGISSGQVHTVRGSFEETTAPSGTSRVFAVRRSSPGRSALMTNCQKAWVGAAVLTTTGVAIGLVASRDADRAISR